VLVPVPAGSLAPEPLALEPVAAVPPLVVEPLAPVLDPVAPVLEPVPAEPPVALPLALPPVAVVAPPLVLPAPAAAVFGGKLMSKFETVPLTSTLPLKRSSSRTSTVAW
jgi:hypothetical protein